MRLAKLFSVSLSWLLLATTMAAATEVQVVGVSPGRSARLSIDGGAAIKLEVGETVEGVNLVQVDRDGATVRIDGASRKIPLGSATGSTRGSTGSRDSIILSAGPGGHFVANGTINGRAVRFLVDTGATLTTLSTSEASRLGLAYRSGQPTTTMTANGSARGWLITLPSVTIHKTTVTNVAAMVIDGGGLPVGLLGMSFLNHFDLQRQGATLVLRRR